MKNYKLLGNCQVCGRLQAVNNGMSKHGYTVEQGWFSGVCSGQNYLPMQQDATITHDVVKSIAEEVADLTKLIADLETGKKHPKTAPIASHYKAEVVAFADAPKYQQEAEIQKHIFASKSRIKAGQQHAEMLLNLLKKVSGKELIQEAKPTKAVAIVFGEKRILNGRVVICKSTVGQRVIYKDERGFNSYTSPQAWRKLELVA